MQHPSLPDHARHDATLIAGHAAGDLSDMERARAEALLSSCDACGQLRRDLVAIAAATRSVPAPASRTRDLRLTAEQADRLRRGSWLRGFLRPFAAASSPLRPMAAAFTSLGIVGLLVGVTMSGVPASSPATSAERDNAFAPMATAAGVGGGAAENHQAGPSERTVLQAAADASHDRATVDDKSTIRFDALSTASEPSEAAAVGGKPAVTSAGGDGASRAPANAAQPPQPTSMLIGGSLALIGVGLLLFGLRIASRRVR